MKADPRRTATLLLGVAAAAVAVAIAASGATARPAQTGSVCVLLPDTKSSVRWEQFDKPAFVKAFKKAGIKATVVNALNDPQKQLSQAEQCIASGAKVGIITSLDTGTSIAIQKKFTAAGGKTIDYDRQIVGGTGSVYVSFDGNQVGRHPGSRRARRHEGEEDVRSERRGCPALGRPDRRERLLVQERQRRHPEPALQDEEGQEGPREVRPASGIRSNAQTIFEQFLVSDEQQHPGRHRRERQHRRRQSSRR